STCAARQSVVGKTTLIRGLNRRPELASSGLKLLNEVGSQFDQNKTVIDLNLKLVSRYLDMARQDRLDDDSSDRLKLYSSSSASVSFIVMDPQAEFIEHDNVRLPPQLPELQKYTENLRQLLEQRGIPRVDLPERDLDIRNWLLLLSRAGTDVDAARHALASIWEANAHRGANRQKRGILSPTTPATTGPHSLFLDRGIGKRSGHLEKTTLDVLDLQHQLLEQMVTMRTSWCLQTGGSLLMMWPAFVAFHMRSSSDPVDERWA
uniref:Septin-type G domain-containing protein n=1 Tax=Macrostomum lignano TaxID=282301 RepID=A0A1I8F852_9PLAT